MSFCRENIIWPSKDGTWNCGHYEWFEINTGSEDFDPEWDVEYDFSRFHWVSSGHATPDAAYKAWRGANPGGNCQYDKRTPECEELDRMRDECLKRMREERSSRPYSYRL